MTNATSNVTFTKMINLSKSDRDIKSLMCLLYEHGLYRDTCKLIPTFIDLRFRDRMDDRNIVVIRRLLKELRPFQLSHYVRFSADLDILMECDCGDIFYSREDRSDTHKDVTFSIGVVTQNHVEIKVRIHPTSKSHLNIRQLSRMTYPILFGMNKNNDEDAIHLEMIKFHRSRNFTEISTNKKEKTHILFIPTNNSGGCITIPLFGISNADAIRRSVYTDKFFSFLHESQSSFISEDVFTQHLSQMLVEAIISNEMLGQRLAAASQTYCLAEILFGYYLRTRELSGKIESDKNRLIWFETVSDGYGSFVESYTVSVKE